MRRSKVVVFEVGTVAGDTMWEMALEELVSDPLLNCDITYGL